MKRAIIYFNNQFCNIAGDRLEEDTHFIRVYNGDMLMGMFDIAAVDIAYISEKKEE